MKDPAYAFTIFFLTLGPLKIISVVAGVTAGLGWRDMVANAFKASLLSMVIALAIFLRRRLRRDFLASIGGRNRARRWGAAPAPPASDETQPFRSGWRTLFGTLERPVLSPIVLPATITPIGVVARSASLCFRQSSG